MIILECLFYYVLIMLGTAVAALCFNGLFRLCIWITSQPVSYRDWVRSLDDRVDRVRLELREIGVDV